MKLKAALVIAVLALAGAAPLSAEASQIEQVPVAGEYHEPAIGGDVAYDGAIYHVWTQAADGSRWDVTSILAAEARVIATGARLSLFGVSAQRVAADPGTQVELDQPIEVASIGSCGGTARVLKLGAELPRMAAVPAVPAIARNLESPEPVAIPVKGQYYESAVAGQVSYEGLITLFWTPPQSGSADWTIDGALVADVVAAGTGVRYVYYGFCKDCFAMAPESTVEMTKPVYAIGVGHAGGYQGSVSVTLALPRGAAFPTVSSVSLASK